MAKYHHFEKLKNIYIKLIVRLDEINILKLKDCKWLLFFLEEKDLSCKISQVK